MARVRQLYELQEIDLEIARKREALAEVGNQLGQDEPLVTARSTLDESQERLASLERDQRAVEWEVDDLRAKVMSLEKKLYGGSVHSPKELLSLQQEVEHLKVRRAHQEDHLLDIMSQVEAAQGEIEAGRIRLEAIERDWRESQQQLSAEQAKLRADLAELERKRSLALDQIDSASLELYQELSRTRPGQAIARVEQGRCQGCRISLPISDLHRARAEKGLVQCSNCGRVLYLS